MRHVAILAAGLTLLGSTALPQEADLVLPEGFEELRDRLATLSLTLSLEDAEEDPRAQDYVAAARADYRRLLTGLYAEGYYGPTISITIDGREAAQIQPLDAPTSIDRIDIDVDPGPLYSFGQAEVAPLAPDTELPEGFATGAPAEADVIRQAATAGIGAWRDVGYAKAEIAEQDIVAIHPQDRLDAEVRLAPGPRLTFGPLIVSGNEDVRTERIRAIANLPTGQIFSPRDLERAARRLRQTGTFNSVALREAEEITPDGALPILAQVDEALPRQIGFGAEISTTDGLRLSAHWLHRNLLGGAERFRIEGEVAGIGSDTGGIDYAINLEFDRPATFRNTIDFSIDASIRRIDEPNYLLDAISAEVGISRVLFDDLTLTAGPGILIAREQTEFRERDYVLLTLPMSAELDRRDNELDATNGIYAELEVTPFYGLRGTDSGARLYADARAYRSFGAEDRFTFAARGQFGSVVGADELEAPADYLFYSGGGGTVRGQAYRSLDITQIADFGEGPVEVTTGGTAFLGAQLEARIGVTERIGAVAFYDIGAIGDEALIDETAEWHAGAGLGVRYNTPIGPIRLDVATPASGDEAGQRVEVYLGIGQAF